MKAWCWVGLVVAAAAAGYSATATAQSSVPGDPAAYVVAQAPPPPARPAERAAAAGSAPSQSAKPAGGSSSSSNTLAIDTEPARQARDGYKLRPSCSKLVAEMASITAGNKAHSSLASGHDQPASAHLWAAQVLTQHSDGRSYALLVAAPMGNADQCEGAYANVFYVPEQCALLVRSTAYSKWTFEDAASIASGAIILSFPSGSARPVTEPGEAAKKSPDQAEKKIPMPTAHLITAGSGCMVILAETILDRR